MIEFIAVHQVYFMSNRLQLFRERMAAFEGAANPQHAVASGYYVNAPGKLFAEGISNRIALRPASSHLLIGGVGSGKTTQLLVACENLKKIGDIYSIYIDVSLYTDISKIVGGVLTAIAGLEISKLMRDSTNFEINAKINLIHQLAYGSSRKVRLEIPFSSAFPGVQFEERKYPGIIPAKKNSDPQVKLINAVRQLAAFVKDSYGHIVLLFDGLDRLDDSKIFPEILDDVKAISNADIGVVIVGPLTSLYGENSFSIESYLDYFYHQPCFDVENDPEAYKFFKQILQGRSQDNFIEEVVIDLLIKFSGGILRDLINLTQASIEETYMSGDERLGVTHVSTAIESFGKAQLLGLDDEELEIMRKTFEIENFKVRTSKDIKLLVTRRIIEYRYPKTRYVVHPTLIPIIEQIYA